MRRFILPFLFGITFLSSAQAGDIKEWFAAQHNAYGQSCCDQADGHRYDDYYEMQSDGSVKLGNGKIIEPKKVLTGPNPTGHAVLWSIGSLVYCFAPGPGF